MPLYVNPSFLFVIWDFDELSLNVTDMTKSANVFCKPFYVTYFEISQNWLEIMWFKGCSYGLSLICPWQLNWYWKWQHLSFFVPFIKPLYPLYQTPLSPFAEGYQLPSGFTNDSYLIFFSPTTNSVHLGQSCFIRCSFFCTAVPQRKQGRDTSYMFLVFLEACTQSSNFHKFSSCVLNTLTSQALVSCCHRILSFEPSDLWGWRQIRFHCAVEHTSNFFWSYQWKVSIWLTHTHNP